MDNISVYYTHTFYMYKSKSIRRHMSLKEYASVAAPWPSSALPAVLLWTRLSVGVERSVLCLPWPPQQLLRGSGGRNPPGGGSGRAPRQPSSIGPPCASPAPPRAASSAGISVVVIVGNVCVISGDQRASLATDIDLWRCIQKLYQRACERGSGEAKRSINEGFIAGVRKVWDPSI